MKKIINSINEYIHFRKMFFEMADMEVFDYDVAPGTVAEYAQAHTLGFSLEQLQFVKALVSQKAAAAKYGNIIAGLVIPTCK